MTRFSSVPLPPSTRDSNPRPTTPFSDPRRNNLNLASLNGIHHGNRAESGQRIDYLVMDFSFRFSGPESSMPTNTWGTRMRFQPFAALLYCGIRTLCPVSAQSVDPTLVREVMTVRDEVARSKQALCQYRWTEHTEVRTKGDLEASTDFLCHYDDSGKVTRTPIGNGKEDEAASAISKRHTVRKKADMQDYIERAVGMINTHVPLDPEQMRHVLQDARASLGPPEAGKSTIRLKDYFQRLSNLRL